MNMPVTPWHHDRPARNCNPGDLRPRTHQPPWPGQDGIDTAPGGPFARFTTAADGWAALGLWCLDARYLRGLRTAQMMIAVFAPASENDTTSYAATVGRRVGEGPLDLSQPDTLEALCRAIAHYEGAQVIWQDAEVAGGMRLCMAHWPAYRAARQSGGGVPINPPAAPPPAPVELTADQLNQREINAINPGTETA